ncbi:MAG: 30S ribosomal protein S4e, partial [Caldisphaera sp.]
GNMGGSRAIKARISPDFWPIPRKLRPWAVKSSPGPHPIERSLPLLILLRDVLGYAESAKEARKVISEGKIKVDGKPVKNYKFPVGAMDVIEIPETEEYYRVVPYPIDYLKLYKISKDESLIKPVRIENKTTIAGGSVQLNLYGGKNIVIKFDKGEKRQIQYKTLDTLLITLPDQEIKDHISLEEGDLAIVMWGKNVGKVGKLISINKQWGWKWTSVTLEGKGGKQFQTALNYILVIGKEKPIISLPGELLP